MRYIPMIFIALCMLLLPAAPTAQHHKAGHVASWHLIESPNPGNAVLSSVTATSRNEAWAMGEDLSASAPILMHWNGKSWKLVKSPFSGLTYSVKASSSGGAPERVTAISARSAKDIWAVGNGPSDGKYQGVFSRHFDGRAWSDVPITVPYASASLTSVAAVPGSHEVWAVGAGSDAGSYTSRPLIELYY